MKCMPFLVVLALVSVTASAAPTEAQKAACKAKVERTLSLVGKALGMGKGVGHIGGAEITESKKTESGKTAYVYSGGMLSAQDIDGYISGSGASTEVIFNNKDCEISKIEVSTGADR